MIISISLTAVTVHSSNFFFSCDENSLYSVSNFQICHTGFSSVQFSHTGVSDSLWPHEPQHARPPCPSPTLGASSNSCPLSQWCHTPSHPLSSPLLPPSIFRSIRVFSNESALHIRGPKYWSFSFNINPSNEHPGLISFRVDWLDLLAVQGTLKSLLPHHTSKASILWCSALFIVQISHPYMTTGKTIALTRQTFDGKVRLLTIITMLYLISPWLIYFITRGLYFLIPFTHFAHHLALNTLHLILCIWGFSLGGGIFVYAPHTYIWDHTVFAFL